MAVPSTLGYSLWLDQPKYESAESKYQSVLASRHLGLKVEGKSIAQNPISSEIEKAMSLIGNSLRTKSQPSASGDLEKRVAELEKANLQMESMMANILKRLDALESLKNEVIPNANDASDDDFELFAPENEASPVQKSFVAKKEKPIVIAKSSIVLDVKPWDDETDLSEMERNVRSIVNDGLKWGASKILPVAYGISKLQISCIVEDDKVGTDFLEESIMSFDDLVQSVDIVAFNKI